MSRAKRSSRARNQSGNPAVRAAADEALDPKGTTDFLLPSLVAVPPFGYEVPRARYVASGTVWHYTTGQGLIGIVENSELWASSFAALNDLEELSCGGRLAVSVFDNVIGSRRYTPRQKQRVADSIDRAIGRLERRPPSFIASASMAKDSLSQWRGYGDGGMGYAVGLDASFGLVPRVKDDSAFKNQGRVMFHDGSDVMWARVVYQPDEQRELVGQALAHIAHVAGEEEAFAKYGAEKLGDYLRGVLLYCKDYAFREEQEVRIVLAPASAELWSFRAGRYGVTPFMRLVNPEIKQEHEMGWLPTATSLDLPITEVMVGPGPNAVSALLGAQELLAAHGLNVHVTASKAPFR